MGLLGEGGKLFMDKFNHSFAWNNFTFCKIRAAHCGFISLWCFDYNQRFIISKWSSPTVRNSVLSLLLIKEWILNAVPHCKYPAEPWLHSLITWFNLIMKNQLPPLCDSSTIWKAPEQICAHSCLLPVSVFSMF